MKAFFACVKKDIKLFQSGAGIAAVCLPVVLMLCLMAFMGDTALGRAYVAPFAIAVRDEDGTPMSRSLIRQLSEIEILSEVIRADAETDDALLSRGAAAVIRLPKDFFYRVYTMDDCPVDILLNTDMPLESALVHSMLTSVLDILSADQQAYRAVFSAAYGEQSPERQYEMYAAAAGSILDDALGRQKVFTGDGDLADAAQQLRLSFFVCAVSLLSMFVPLVTLKTLPDELAMGILPRYIAAGGSVFALLMSKLVSALALTLPPAAALFLIVQPARPLPFALTVLLLFFASFGLFLLLSACARSAARSQLYGNLTILFMLVAGGALYPVELLPRALQALAPLTLPYYALVGVRAASGGLGIADMLAALWPLVAAAVLLPLPAMRILRKGGRR